MHRIFILVFTISLLSVPWKTVDARDSIPPPITNSVKWHPGHYYALMGYVKNNPKQMAQVYKELEKTPAIRGLQIRYEWSELEPVEGVYNFAAIDQHLAELAKRKKRLIIMLQLKSFSPDSDFVPSYLKEGKYEDGVFAFSTFGSKKPRGYNIKLWNPLVHNRLIALVSALGNHFNSHPYFEGIGLTETAMGQLATALSSKEVDTYYSHLLSINQHMRKYFPNTMTFQFTNYPRPILRSFISQLREMGTGLGGPDIFLDEPGLHLNDRNSPKGVYNYYPELSGIVPLTPSVMQANYANSRHDKTGREPTLEELHTFARDKLKANYIFWTRAPGYYPKVLKMLRDIDVTHDSAGGLNITCPAAYSSCLD